MQPIEVTALTAGEFDPSRRFRICQFVDGLKMRGIDGEVAIQFLVVRKADSIRCLRAAFAVIQSS